VVIPDAYDEELFGHVDRVRPRGASTRVVSVGRLVEVKGYDLLVEAVARLVAAGTDVELEIIGVGPNGPALGERIAALGLAERVRLRGSLARGDLPGVLAAADLFASPSRREGFGVAIVEALATGLPVVATRSGGPEDIVGDGDGVLVDPGSADALAAGIAEAIGRLDSFDAAGIAARARERFSRQVVAGRLVALYRDIAAGSSA
jgi:glycosyltransferase involved in cell wall biosynthesis